MKKLLAFLITLFIVGTLYTQIFIPDASSYSFLVHVLDCDNVEYLRGCRHEIGHKMDDDLGKPSESYEFEITLQYYILTELAKDQPSELATFLDTYPDHEKVELYAAIYAYVDGNVYMMPEIFQRFYSTDVSYLELYSCLSRPNRMNICDGTNFSYIAE